MVSPPVKRSRKNPVAKPSEGFPGSPGEPILLYALAHAKVMEPFVGTEAVPTTLTGTATLDFGIRRLN
jgi:hypothetical protein